MYLNNEFIDKFSRHQSIGGLLPANKEGKDMDWTTSVKGVRTRLASDPPTEYCGRNKSLASLATVSR